MRRRSRASTSRRSVDVVCLVLDATAPFGDGDRWVANHLDLPRSVVVVNKIDVAGRDRVAAQLAAAAELDAEAYFPVSARTGDGVPALVEHLVARMPEGPAYFPAETVRDVPDEQWVAELVREQLLAVTRDELPYSIATRVSEWEGDRITVEILVERREPEGHGHRPWRARAEAGRRARPCPAARGDPPDAARARSTRTGSAAPTGWIGCTDGARPLLRRRRRRTVDGRRRSSWSSSSRDRRCAAATRSPGARRARRARSAARRRAARASARRRA